ncbi:hypothetical protein [Actinophytocola glycyrrhizae]|uniref:LppP/LprE lipoprotein n=1 Tax=Actinophytocola glycyrrhizae TaxID=2044873 RepID=A0ABV9S815_9PSEU
MRGKVIGRALLCGLAMLCAAGCATQGGVEVAGRASQVSPPPSAPTLPSGTPASADPVAILRADPQVEPRIKDGLVPCDGGQYPTDDRYVDLTGDGKSELVVLLLTCPRHEYAKPMILPEPSGLVAYAGYAAFVYDLTTEPPTRLLGVEGPAIDLVPANGKGNELVLIRSAWSARDDPCCPSDQSLVLYRWNGTRLVEVPK